MSKVASEYLASGPSFAEGEVIERIVAFRNEQLEALGDGAVLALPSGERLAFSTDSFVVQPLRFPGGSIRHLAVHGAVNDLAMAGRQAVLNLRGVRAGGGLHRGMEPGRQIEG